MKTEIIDWTGVVAPSGFPLPVWIDLLTSGERGAVERRGAAAVRMGFVKVSEARLMNAAPAFPGFQAGRPPKRRGRNAHKVAAAVDRGTPETRAKLRADVVAGLFRRAALDAVHVTAANRIASVREALGRGLTPGAVQLGERVDGGGGQFRDPMARMSASEGRWWLGEYRPWLLDLVGDPPVRVTARKRQVMLCAIGLTMAVVVDNWGVQEAEEFCGLPRKMGVGQALLRVALDRYALIAGLRSGAKITEFAGLSDAA
ncbi:hypothetical protein [Parvibaculum sp.]|uniref:hypothetical protein n=1 Tax=Parvibaculum sp. TaxID=2024848 RepID=UPI001D277E59|nr:hypothetical protein [Parvibaculum sp.]MBX3488881.1 hypothetical protein [Parvibaculum sp.]